MLREFHPVDADQRPRIALKFPGDWSGTVQPGVEQRVLGAQATLNLLFEHFIRVYYAPGVRC